MNGRTRTSVFVSMPTWRYTVAAISGGVTGRWAVDVPAVERRAIVPLDLHEARAGLDQPPRQQARLADEVRPVAFAQLVLLAGQVESNPHARRREHVGGALLEGVHLIDGAVGLAA